jgi:hypothetical protein
MSMHVHTYVCMYISCTQFREFVKHGLAFKRTHALRTQSYSLTMNRSTLAAWRAKRSSSLTTEQKIVGSNLATV